MSFNQGQLPTNMVAGERTSTCYNCGASGHYLTHCPEPVRQLPAGLAAARAAQSAHNGLTSSTAQHLSPNNNNNKYPSKRQRMAWNSNPAAPPVVTRYNPDGSVQSSGPFVPQYPPNANMPPHQQQQFGPDSHRYLHGTQAENANMTYLQPPHAFSAPPFHNGYAPGHAYGMPPQSPQVSYQPGPPQPYGYGDNAPLQYYPQAQTEPYQQPLYSGGQHMPVAPNAYDLGHYSASAPQYQQGGYPPNTGYVQHPPVQTSAPPRVHHSYNPSHGHWQSPNVPFNPSRGRNASFGRSNSAREQSLTQSTSAQSPLIHQSLRDGQPNQNPRRESVTTHPSPALSYSSHSKGLNQANVSLSQQFDSPGTVSFSGPHETNEEYEWDYLYAFREHLIDTTLPMACPLPDVWNDVPIPAPAAGTDGMPSRYVRMASVEVWCKPIRESLQWPLFQNDPIFFDLDLNGPSFPIKGLAETITRPGGMARKSSKHSTQIGKDEQPLKEAPIDYVRPARKRSRSVSTNGHEEHASHKKACNDIRAYIPMSIVQTVESDVREATPALESDDPWGIRSSSGAMGSDRGITPSLISDDAWAPQAGEAVGSHRQQIPIQGIDTTWPLQHRDFTKSQSPGDPTEALLASLGVTGAPKPVPRQRSRGIPRPPPGAPFLMQGAREHRKFNRPGSREGSQFRQDSGYMSASGVKDKSRSSSLSHEFKPPTQPRSWSRHASSERTADSPLSPTSLMLLGHDPTTSSNGTTGPAVQARRGGVRQMSGERMKKSQPIVDKAYSRRW